MRLRLLCVGIAFSSLALLAALLGHLIVATLMVGLTGAAVVHGVRIIRLIEE